MRQAISRGKDLIAFFCLQTGRPQKEDIELALALEDYNSALLKAGFDRIALNSN
jgi:hypothetical protein